MMLLLFISMVLVWLLLSDDKCGVVMCAVDGDGCCG